jgi:chromosome segregation ATPase
LPKKKKEEEMISGALADIESELANLKTQKKSMETRIKHVTDDISVTQSEEARLREEISGLVGKEGILDRKRNKLKDRLEELNGKISKVGKVKDELIDL